MKLRGERHAAMDSAAEQAESTRRLAVHHVEGIGGMEPLEGRRGLAQPVAVACRPARLPRRDVAEVPGPAEVRRLREPVTVLRGDGLDLVAGLDESAAEVGGVALHSTDAMGVARNRDDADTQSCDGG